MMNSFNTHCTGIVTWLVPNSTGRQMAIFRHARRTSATISTIILVLTLSASLHTVAAQQAATFPSGYPVQKMGHGYSDRDPGTGNPRVNLDNLKELSVAKARELGSLAYLEVSLRGLKRLSPEAARALVANRTVHVLDISGLEEVSEELAAELEPYQWSLYLNGVKRLSPGAARALHRRKRFGPLQLESLPHISPELASEFANFEEALLLDGVESLEPAAAKNLGRKTGNPLWLGLTTLTSEATACGLAATPCELVMNDLRTLSPEAARGLATKKGSRMGLGITSINAAVASELAKCQCDLHLDNLLTLDRDAALEISEVSKGTNEPSVWLWSDRPKRVLGIQTITPEVSSILEKHFPIKYSRRPTVK